MSSFRQSVLRVTSLLGLGLACLVLLGALFPSCVSRALIYPGPQVGASDAYYQGFFEPEDAVEVTTMDGHRLRGWLLNRGKDAPLVVMYGGNAMNVGGFYDIARQNEHCSYLLLNYRGYGGSEGTPAQEDIVADSIQAIDWAKGRLGGGGPLYLVGLSIGSGVAVQVAAKVDPDKLILICPFDSLESVARQMLGSFGAYMVRDDAYRSTELAPQINCLVTIFAGHQDVVVPPAHTQALIDSFTQVRPQVYWLDAGHNDLMSTQDFDRLFTPLLRD